LWPVGDETTTLLIRDFYRRLYDRAGEKINTKARALQQAMLALREQKEHPYYWAPFKLTGTWR
jgi:CHAT domain-containing protein